jgi:hypothetical protein
MRNKLESTTMGTALISDYFVAGMNPSRYRALVRR